MQYKGSLCYFGLITVIWWGVPAVFQKWNLFLFHIMQPSGHFTLTAHNTHSLAIRTGKAKKPREANVTLEGWIKDGVEKQIRQRQMEKKKKVDNETERRGRTLSRTVRCQQYKHVSKDLLSGDALICYSTAGCSLQWSGSGWAKPWGKCICPWTAWCWLPRCSPRAHTLTSGISEVLSGQTCSAEEEKKNSEKARSRNYNYV